MRTISAIRRQDPVWGRVSLADKGRTIDVLEAVRDLCLKVFVQNRPLVLCRELPVLGSVMNYQT